MNIIEMGQKAGLCDKEGRDDNSIIIEDHLERFAALVEAAARADEREECAKACEEVGQWPSLGPKDCAYAIRERGTT